jgi:glycolate oxidase iron-sulfur subunit
VVCPAKVPYGRLIDGVRAELERQRPASLLRRGLRWLAAEGFVRNPWWLRRAVGLLRGYRGSALAGRVQRVLGRLSPRFHRLSFYLPPLLAGDAWSTVYRARGEPRGEVTLFLGCVARELDRATLEASVRVLTRLGYTVHAPPAQACCGAIHLHDGAEGEALARAARNIRAFEAFPGLPVVVTASGCGATLAEYDRLPDCPRRFSGPPASSRAGWST